MIKMYDDYDVKVYYIKKDWVQIKINLNSMRDDVKLIKTLFIIINAYTDFALCKYKSIKINRFLII